MKRNKIVENRWVTMLEDEFQLANGTDIQYYHVLRADVIMSIVLDVTEIDVKTYVVHQHRHPIGEGIWQFPLGGVIDGEDNYCKTAEQELEEETGVNASEFEYMGSFFADPGFTNQKLHVCISQTINEVGSQQLEDSEFGLICKKISVRQVPELIESGEMGDAWGIAGHHYLQRYLAKYDI